MPEPGKAQCSRDGCGNTAKLDSWPPLCGRCQMEHDQRESIRERIAKVRRLSGSSSGVEEAIDRLADLVEELYERTS